MKVTLDIEACGLLDDTTIDYTVSPYKLKDTFKMWCIVCIDIETKEVYKFVNEEIKTSFREWSKQVTTVIAHNGIDYDLLALKLFLDMDYSIGATPDDPDLWDGREVEIIDTLIISKALNPDRFGGHSLDEWGKRVGYNKIDWRAEAVELGLIKYNDPKGAEFWQFHPNMVDYCLTPNHKVLKKDTLDWVELGTLVVGDKILGFDEEGPNRCYKTTVVESILRKPAEVYEVSFKSGKKFKTTANHKWLVRRGKGRHVDNTFGGNVWVETQNLRYGKKCASRVPSYIPMWEEKRNKDAGWLAGMFDGEGYFNKHRGGISIAQRPTNTLLKLEQLLADNEYKTTKRFVKKDSDCCSLGIRGSVGERLKFLGEIKPQRLIDKMDFEDFGRLELKSPGFLDEVVSVDFVGIEDIIVMQTSTRTFICEGYPMHNCVRDNEVTVLTYEKLLAEKADWPWEDALWLEKAVAEIVTRQKHRGFDFKKDKAEAAVRDLDNKIMERKEKVEPILPVKLLPKTKQKEFTPPAKQFKQDGTANAHLINFVNKHNGVLNIEARQVELLGKNYDLPLKPEPLVTHIPATLKDTTHIKEWLVGLGWSPSEYKEKDLTVDAKKKKLTQEKFIASVERYVAQTLVSNFCKDRCEHLRVSPQKLHEKLRKHDLSKPLKVLTNPSFTKGQEKEIDPMLEQMSDVFPFAIDIVQFLTYQHRRNSILGGGFDPDEDDEDDFEKGYLANIRADGRISTPADTCDCGTSRFRHKVVANIPRVTSLYGGEMRSMFGVSDGFLQVGYDFDSLEARVEAHYVHKYEGGVEYGYSLTAEKPNDCHTVLAKKISQLIHQEFARGTAKSVKYGCSYNAQPPRIAKTVGCDINTANIIFDAFWTQASPLKELKENMITYWETTGKRQFLLGIDRRKLPIRSKGNVINTAFQSCGVICAKRAMVIHDRKLKEKGLIVDFFKDDWRSKKFCQQMIAYHK